LKVALIQLNSGGNKKKNLDRALRLTYEAARKNAEWILLPEVFNYRGRAHPKNGYRSIAEPIPGPSTIPLMILARAHRVFILMGSLYEKTQGKKSYNTSILINDKGNIVAKYRKINLFRARLPRRQAGLSGNAIDESKNLLAGKSPRIAAVKNFKVGLSICYDLRFPELYRRYKKAGADILCVPSSFTKPTGEAHWKALLRARAIENLAYVLAPAQFGKTPSGVVTYGHSMVVDPWGRVLKEASGNREEIIYATIEKSVLAEQRKKLPGV